MRFSLPLYIPRSHVHTALVFGFLCSAVSAQSTVPQTQPSNLTFLTAFPTTYIKNQAAKTEWAADPSNQNPMNLYLMDYTGLEVRQACCENVPYPQSGILSCIWWPDGYIYPNNNYKLMINQTGSRNYTAGDVTILAAGTTALNTLGPEVYGSTTMVTSTTATSSGTAVSSTSNPTDPQVQSQASSLSTGSIAGIAIGVGVAVAIIALLAFLLYRKNHVAAIKATSAPESSRSVTGGDTKSVRSLDLKSAPSDSPVSTNGTLVGTVADADENIAAEEKAHVAELPRNEKPAEMMDPESQPRFELDGSEVHEMSAHRRFSFEF